MAVKNVVLVHGAFADGSSWSKVIPLLLAKGFRVTSVAIPLTSYAEDVAATKRAIGAQEGPVLLVGHSYGGVVITEAGNDPKVAGLVYVAAFAPDANQSIGDISKTFPKPPGLDELRPLPDGYLLLSAKGIEEDFAQDLTASEKALLIAVQAQTAGAIFEAKPTAAAWRSRPSWYIIAAKDRMIAPEQEQAMAQNICATATRLPSSHVVMLSHPKEVADVIADAAEAAALDGQVMTLDELKAALLGSWVSIAPEVRTSRNPDGTLKPFFLKRSFVYLPDDRFELTVVNYADPYGTAPVAKIDICGHMFWRGEHPIAPFAHKVDFVADEAYAVTPLIQAFADLLNKVATDGYARWEVGQRQDIFGKSFLPFGLVKREHFKEYDLVYLAYDMLFWGARHVDGRGFDTEANRPANLQIPLVRARRAGPIGNQ